MKGKVIPSLVLAGLCLATCAMALDMSKRLPTTLPERVGGFELNALFQCDDNVPYNAYYQDPNGRYGNVWTFSNERVSQVQFVHYGWGFAGPYNYDIELWDAATCTYIGGKNNLVAGNAATALRTETVNLTVAEGGTCLNGDIIVAIDANTCIAGASPPDCYPDLFYDDQLFVACPVIVDAINFVCTDVSDQSGPFLLRATTVGCVVDVKPSSWGKVKTLYR